MGDGHDIPESHQRGPRLVRLPALMVLKVELYRQLRKTGITRAELSRRLRWKRESVDRLLRFAARGQACPCIRQRRVGGLPIAFPLACFAVPAAQTKPNRSR
jgi:hypothetical protein